MKKSIVISFLFFVFIINEFLSAQSFYIETNTSAKAAGWLKALVIKPSPDAVVDAMNPYHIQRIIPDLFKKRIHEIGMASFYSDNVLKRDILLILNDELSIRSKLMKAGGLYYCRNLCGEGFWEIIEPQNDNFQFEITDLILNKTLSGGGQSLMVIQPYSSWDQKAGGYAPNPMMTGDFAIYGDFFVLRNNTVSPAFNMNDYRDFLQKLKKHTGQKVYEIANEMDGGGGATYPASLGGGKRYAGLLKATREALGPDCYIVNGGSIGFVSGTIEKSVDEFWRDFFNAGGGNTINALNIHYNCEINFFDPKASSYDPTFKHLLTTLDYFNNSMKKHSIKKDLWITEISIGDPVLTEEQIAEWFLKKFSFAACRGVKKIFIDFADSAPVINANAQELPALARSAMFYKVGKTFVAQLIFYTQKLMNLKLSGFTGCSELVFGEQYCFDINGRQVFVLWGDKRLPGTLRGKKLKVIDVFGNIFSVEASMNSTVSSVSGDKNKPVFVELE